MMMKKMKVFAIAILTLSMIAMSQTVKASTVDECQTLINNLRAATAIVGLKNADKDRPALLLKLDEASSKLQEAKFCDAIQKINDFKANVAGLASAAKAKINIEPSDEVTAEDLLAGADGVIACLNDLVTQSGVTCDTITD